MSCCEKKLSFDLILFAIIIFALNNFQSFRSCLLVWVYLGCFIIIILFIYIYIYIYKGKSHGKTPRCHFKR